VWNLSGEKECHAWHCLTLVAPCCTIFHLQTKWELYTQHTWAGAFHNVPANHFIGHLLGICLTSQLPPPTWAGTFCRLYFCCGQYHW
jgi:hypothetical protein